MTKYLREFAIKFDKDQTKYPWRVRDCLFGDYERIYHSLFMGYHPLYQEIYFGKQFKSYGRNGSKKNAFSFLSSIDQLKLKYGGKIGNFLERFDNEDPSQLNWDADECKVRVKSIEM
jgi:hypothetical protein